MTSIYNLKPQFQNLLRPTKDLLAERGVSANQVTLAAMGLSMLLGALIALLAPAAGPLLLLPPFLLFRMALNAIDGMLARENHQKSPLGAILNEVGDAVSDAALYLPFALIPGVNAPLLIIVVAAALISEVTGLTGPQIGATRRYDGPMGKSDRAFWFGALALLLGLGVPGGWWVTLVLIAMLVALGLTIRNRAMNILAEAGSGKGADAHAHASEPHTISLSRPSAAEPDDEL